MSRPLDRARPLWELYVIEGHESGLVGVLTKIHHAVIDGLSGAEIMALLLDLTPEGREVPPAPRTTTWPTRRRPTLQMLALGLLGLPRYPVRMLRALPKAIPNLEDTPFGDLPGRGHARRSVAGVFSGATASSGRTWSRPRRSSTAASRRTGASSSASCRSSEFKAAKNNARRDGQRRRRRRSARARCGAG